MMIGLERGIEFYLSTLATEGKSPSYIGGLQTRLRYFSEYIEDTHGDEYRVKDLTVEDGRGFIRMLQSRTVKYADHPMREPVERGLKPHYIHGCGRAVRSFSTWAHEEGYLDENVMRKLKLPRLPQTQPEPLTEEEIKAVLAACLAFSKEPLRNYAMLTLFLDTGIRLGELLNLKISDIDFTTSEMKVFGKGSKERTVPIGHQARRALVEYLSRERPEPKNPREEEVVFLTADGYAISKSAVHKVFHRVRDEAGLDKF
jgi:site-specific recombinase XerD